jgi:hypothetical protein
MSIPSIYERDLLRRYEPYSYLIYKTDAGLIVAENGKTGEPEFWGTDAATVIQQAMDAVVERGVIVFRSDVYDIYSTITINKEATLDLGKAVINLKKPTTLFHVKRGLLRVRGGIIWGQNQSGETAFLIDSVPGCLFEDVRFDHVYYPFYLKGSVWELRIYGCVADYCQSLLMTDPAVTDVNINMRDTWASHIGGDGIVVRKSNAILMHNCQLIDIPNGSPLRILSRYGGDIWISECEFDNYAYAVEVGPDVPDFHFVHCYFNQSSATTGGHAIRIYDGCFGGRITGCHIYARLGHGIYVSGMSSLDIHIIDNRVLAEAGSYSILLENTARIKVIGNQCSQPIRESGTSDWNLFIANSNIVDKVGYHSKVVGSMDAEYDVYKFPSYPIPVGEGNTYDGSTVDIPKSGHVRLPWLRLTISGVASGETITVKIIAWFDDDSTQYIEKSYTANGVYLITPSDIFDLLKDGKRITRLEYQAKSNLASTSATVYRELWGI